jgi:hypothetical protein
MSSLILAKRQRGTVPAISEKEFEITGIFNLNRILFDA